MEFHISRQARDHYKFDETLFAYDGNVIFANFLASRVFAQRVNESRDLVNYPEHAIKAGQINSMGLIDEIFHHCFALYRQSRNPNVLEQALTVIEKQFGKARMNNLFLMFINEFPPIAVYKNLETPEEYLNEKTEGVSNRSLVLEELIMLWLSNKNPALAPYQEFFSDENLFSNTIYSLVMIKLQDFFIDQPKFGPEQQNLLEMLRTPAILVPYSIEGQLDYIRTHWSDLLGSFLYRILGSLDLLKEESKLAFFGAGPTLIPLYSAMGTENEPEMFSPDKEWMPRLVLLAKNTYVWLEQLSKKYRKSITRLDQIPDEELDLLAQRGFSGLWLIGLWERSKASAMIKNLCGNPDAISSAYSLFSYDIASDLGGEIAYQDLQQRATRRGLRLASDMVPNHMGIDSPWVADHPDWFLSLPESPYPSHTFNGPNLSNHPGLGIQIEDHYYDRSDAAVEFKRTDYGSGQASYIYHGNDGTSMPWNDTAQLNYLNPEVREMVIQTILSVARRFPIIRFDAAMTLTKKHYQRLWFPEPGGGGAIPSRAEHSMSKTEFNQAIPNEFWREVVDRVAKETPDTLLLAEAFWLMEGYFVRTLGMHRVYNSAFMNMLRNEDNASYRTLIKNTLEFEPDILKRYVNFMNNPDERTTVEQFGKGDKYFGICTVMVTLPGLPMFGHGQVEGLSEKYGMEFKKALWDEQVDQDLVNRHEREIFPLLHNRALFAGVENFLLFDLYTPSGSVDEDVFAYSNALDDKVTLVIFNNRFTDASGWLKQSSGYITKSADGKKHFKRKSIAEGLHLTGGTDSFLIFRDQTSGLQHLRPIDEIIEKGFQINLHAYEHHVFLDMQQINDDPWHTYRRLYEFLNGRGVPSIQEAMKQLMLEPVMHPLNEIFNRGYFEYLMEHRFVEKETFHQPTHLLNEVEKKATSLIEGAASLAHLEPKPLLADEIKQRMEVILSLSQLDKRYPLPKATTYRSSIKNITQQLKSSPKRWLILFSWGFLHNLGKLSSVENPQDQTLSWMDEWQIGKTLENLYKEMGFTEEESWSMTNMVKLLINQQNWSVQLKNLSLKDLMESWLKIPEIQIKLGLNRYKDMLWFNQEGFEDFLWWSYLLAILNLPTGTSPDANTMIESILKMHTVIEKISKAEKKSGFLVQKLLALLEKKPRNKTKSIG
jgi:glycosidase